jgi:uncharacterized protein
VGETVEFGELFEWDAEKAAQNPVDHNGVTFVEASSVFEDTFARYEFDHEHSVDEDRFAVLGSSNQDRTLVVIYTVRENRVRIISARLAEPRERKSYANPEKA